MDATNSLMECEECHELVHAICLSDFGINCEMRTSEMPNYWKCYTCIRFPPKPKDPEPVPNADQDKNNSYNLDIVKHEIVEKDESEKMDVDDNSASEPTQPSTALNEGTKTAPVNGTISENMTVKEEPNTEGYNENCVEMKDTSEVHVKQEVSETFSNAERLKLRVDEYFARKHDIFGKFKVLYNMEIAERHETVLQDPHILMQIFKNLNTPDLLRCRLVSRTWNQTSRHEKFDQVVDLSGLKITVNMITKAVEMKPETMVLDWTNVGKQQLSWLLPKVPTLRCLSLAGLEFSSQVHNLIQNKIRFQIPNDG